MLKERAKTEIRTIIAALKVDKMTLEQAQLELNQVNQILKYKHLTESRKTKSSFLDNVFLIGSIVLGSILTISSFIWGVI